MSKNLETRIGYIYKIVSPNGKIYIGQTLNWNKRKSDYRQHRFNQQIKLWNSCNAHNWRPEDTFEVIEECVCGVNKAFLNEREKYWIAFYDSFKNGLNCNEGGEGNVGHKHSEKTKEKLRNAHLGRKHSEERNKQKSEYTKGRKHSEEAKKLMSEMKKKNMTDEVKGKISNGLKGNKNGIGNKGDCKKILCITNGIIYESIIDAARKLNLHDTGIINVCKGRAKQTKGYKFKYYEEENSSF